MSHRLGIEIGGTKLQLVAGDADGAIHERHRFTVDAAAGAPAIRARIEAVLPGLIAMHRPARIGVGFGGPVDIVRGTVAVSHQVAGWSGFALRDWLQHLGGVPVAVENDANTAALGEARCGAGRGFNPAFYMNMGSGVGGGLVLNNLIYHGNVPGEVEIGHVRLGRDNTTVEDRCSGWAVDRSICELLDSHPDSALASRCKGQHGGEARHLASALAAGDALARQILDTTADDLAFALSHVTHLFHPQVITLGGGLSLVGEPLREAVASQLPRYLMKAFGGGPVVKLSALGEDAVPVGALLL